MKNTILTILTVLIASIFAGCALAGSGNPASGASAPAGIGEYKKFLPASEGELLAAAAAGKVSPDQVIAKTVSGFDLAVFSRLGFSLGSSYEMDGYRYFRLAAKDRTVKRLAALAREPGVIYAEHELVATNPVLAATDPVEQSPKGAAQIRAVLDDPLTWGRFGHFETTNAIAAYSSYGFGPNTVYVADIDYGINRIHEDFMDADGNQIVEFAKSAFVSSDHGASFSFVGFGSPFVTVPANENWDDDGHGSHTAGTIAAIGNNGKGLAGVAWKNVRLISYKCYANAPGSGSTWSIYAGLKDLVDWKKANGITQTIPVNMSIGGSYASSYALEMINLALANGIVIIASMGNEGFVGSEYPAAYAGVIAVGATRANGERADFSSMGKHISVMAPGYNIYSTSNSGPKAYEDMSGTSMSAPFVTGLVAYMLSFNPTLSLDQIKSVLEATATDMGSPGWDKETGYGQVDVKAAVGMVKNGPLPLPGSVYCATKITVSVRNNNVHYDSGIVGHEKAVVGQTVSLFGPDGKYITLSETNGTDGTTEFRNLKPGSYTLVANYLNVKKQLTVNLDNSADKNANLDFDDAAFPLLVQTVQNMAVKGGVTGADTILAVYDDAGNILAGPYDEELLDSIAVTGLVSGRTYYVAVTQFEGSTGEYGLNVGFVSKMSVNTLNGRGAGADDALEVNDARGQAAPIAVGTDYGLYLGNADWFSFVMP